MKPYGFGPTRSLRAQWRNELPKLSARSAQRKVRPFRPTGYSRDERGDDVTKFTAGWRY